MNSVFANDGVTTTSRTLVVAWFTLAALYYLAYSLSTVFHWAPHSLYADQWRQYVDYVTLPFPQNVLKPDNGHRLVLPNFIAWLEIRWFDGNQWLQIGIGILCGFLASMIAAWNSLRDRSVPLMHRAAALFLCFFAIFWLANVRTLFHSTELLHTKLPMFCLIAAIALAIRAASKARISFALVAALLLALAATFSFGYGLSVFLGVFATLVACKARIGVLTACAAMLAATAALYLALPGSDGVRGSITFAPLENLLAGARWLGAPFVTMFSYLWDPNASGLVPTEPLRHVVGLIATAASPHLPDMHSSVMPQALFGGLGMIALIVVSARRLIAREAAGRMEAVGLGIAWFGLGAAGIVSLSRLAYFREFPDQIYADRYLCWPCLFWLGLALIGLSRTRAAKRTGLAADDAHAPAAAAKVVLAMSMMVPLCAWPAQYGGTIYAALVRGHVDNMATGSMVGVFQRGADTGENVADEFARGIPEIAPHRIAQFADPPMAMLGKVLPSEVPMFENAKVEASAVEDNLLGGPGTAVTVPDLQVPGLPQRLLLVDASSRTVVGLICADPRVGPRGYSGYARGVLGAQDLRIASLP